ncbi:MAG: hypothetical protein IPP82_01190 [Xanthomonadales bacterium]|nr:hypothetical protein [Xanthomonadales bacterium]
MLGSSLNAGVNMKPNRAPDKRIALNGLVSGREQFTGWQMLEFVHFLMHT